MKKIKKVLDNIDKRDALIKKGFSAYQSKKYREAIKYYDKVLEIDPKNVLALSDKSPSLKKLVRYEDAKACFELMRVYKGNDLMILGDLAWRLEKVGRFEESLKCYDKMFDLFEKHNARRPFLGHVLQTKVQVLISLVRYNDAIETCNDVRKRYPDLYRFVRNNEEFAIMKHDE
ncbi:MAG: tetratricopeptide repeat protein [Nitrosopumilaceae archaeon]